MFRAKRAVKARADTPFRGPLKRGHDGGRHPHKKLKAMSMEELEDGAVAGAGHVRFQPSGDIRPITSTSGTATAAGVERVGHVSLGHPRCHVRPSPPQTGPTGTISENSSDSTDYDDVCDSSTSSSVPSPEVFRHDSYGMPDFFSEDVPATPVDQKHQVKNSTLRGSARVASGRRHQHASVSTVLYASPHTNTQMSNKGAIADNLQTSRDKALRGKSPKSTLARRPVSCRKIQRFKSPVVAKEEASSPRKKQNPRVDGEATFFEFDNDSVRKEFFRQARERHAKLIGFSM